MNNNQINLMISGFCFINAYIILQLNKINILKLFIK